MAERVDQVTTLPPYKRHVATLNAQGKSVYVDCLAPQYIPLSPALNAGYARTYAVAQVPTKLQDDQDLKAYTSLDASTSWTQPYVVVPDGVTLFVTELGPGASSPMHRTVSIDFAICTNGEVEHELDSGETVRLKAGDHLIQRGTAHRWKNTSATEATRILAITIACETFDFAGQRLEESWNL